MKKKPPYIWRLLLAIDQFFNVLLWNGHEDETISSNLGKRMTDGTASWIDRIISRMLNWIDPNHVYDAIEEDEGYDG